MKKIKVLHISGTMNMGGQETFIMNIMRNINRNKIQFDFVVHDNKKNYFEDEIEKLGGHIYKITPISKNPIKHIFELRKVLVKGKYNVVHRHSAYSIVFIDLLVAKLCKIKKIITHSHANGCKNKFIHKMFIPFINLLSTDKFACSDAAGKWMFGHSKFIVIPNAININDYIYNEKSRNKIRKQYHINSKEIVIGNVGVFRTEKNQIWMINMFKKLIEYDKNYKLMICGDGDLRAEIQKTIKQLSLSDNVILTGNVDTSEYYSAFDIFLLPSIYEGLGIVLIEAQVSGLPCIVSNQIQNEAIISKSVSKLDFNYNKWINTIKKTNYIQDRVNIDDVKYEKYDILKLCLYLENNVYK